MYIFCCSLLFTSSSPGRKDQFAVSYFSYFSTRYKLLFYWSRSTTGISGSTHWFVAVDLLIFYIFWNIPAGVTACGRLVWVGRWTDVREKLAYPYQKLHSILKQTPLEYSYNFCKRYSWKKYKSNVKKKNFHQNCCGEVLLTLHEQYCSRNVWR